MKHSDLLFWGSALFGASAPAAAAENPPANVSARAGEGASRPNILLCVADDASWLHFGAYGCGWVRTPAFDRVAREGILFENCYTPNAKSGPSRATLLTGLYSWQAGAAGNHIACFPEDLKVFTEVLAEAGYDVAFTGKGWAPGDPGMKDGEKRRLTGRPVQQRKLTPPTTEILDNDYAGNLSDFLSGRRELSRPWFFWFGCREPHRHYEYGSAVRAGRTTDEIDRVPAFWPDTEAVRNDMLDYGLEVEHYDRQLGLMLEYLAETGELENTVVIVTSDNGMPFPRAKGTQYEYAHHLPLAIMWPRGLKRPGRHEAGYVSFVDIAPTLLDLAEADPDGCGMKPMAGASLRPMIENRRDPAAALRERALLGRERHDNGRPGDEGYPIRGIVRDGYLYLCNLAPDRLPAGYGVTGYRDIDSSPTKTAVLEAYRSGRDRRYFDLTMGRRAAEELYYVTTDRECLNDLAGRPEYRALIDRLHEELFEALRAQGDPRVVGDGSVFERYPYDKPGKERIYERTLSGEIVPWEQSKWIIPSDYGKGDLD